MKRERLFCAMVGFAIAGWMLACGMSAAAQERGTWRALSTTAQSITGDVAFSDEKLWINYSSFPMANIRSLNAAEVGALFEGESGTGSLYRLSIAAGKKFLHRNTLCGDEDTQWMAAFVSGRTLRIAFFSGPAMPVFTPNAIANTTNLCGTYSYSR